MILENFKKMIKSDCLLRLLMAAVFISAGLFRIFNPAAAEIELNRLSLPFFLSWIILVIEIGGGFFLLFNKFVKETAVVSILFLVFALVNALVVSGRDMIVKAGELFVFDANPTDFFMHFVFLIILISLLIKKSFR